MTDKKRHLLRSLIDRLIPDRYMNADFDTRRRARIIVNFTFAMSAFGPLYGLVYWLRYDLPDMAIMISSLAVFCSVTSTYFLRRTKNLLIPSINSLACLALCLFILIAFLGGINSSTFVWFPIVPAVAIMFLGSAGGYLWTFLMIAICVGFFFLDRFGVVLPYEFPEQHRSVTMVSSVTGASIFMMMVANLYESAKNHMLEEVRTAKAKAEFHRSKAEESHQRARMVLDAVDQGFVMIDPDGTMNREHSSALEHIVGSIPANDCKVWDYFSSLSTEIADWLELTWSQLEMTMLPASLILDQIPDMFRVSDQEVYLSVVCQTIEG